MTHQTAVELIRRLDLDRTLAAAGRLTQIDLDATSALWQRVAAEDQHQRGAQ